MIKKFLLGFLILFVAIQFVRPARNIALKPSADDIVTRYSVPKDVAAILRNACYDCHSNTTKYPWYANIQPVAWWLDSHVRDGKRVLNFSDFGAYSKGRAESKLGDIIDEVEEKRMPLKSYLPMHPEARLTPEEVKKLVTWAEDLTDELAAN